MRVTETKFPDKFLILPNIEYFFGEVRNRENCLDIVESFSFKGIAEIHLTRLGAFAFTFLDSGPLRSIMHYKTSGSGITPEHVMQNHDEIVELQGRRLIFANFIAAAFFGRISALLHSALSGAQYVGMDKIIACTPSGSELVVEHSKHTEELFSPKIRLATQKPSHVKILTPEEINEALAFLSHITERENEFSYADLQTCMVMNYQAAILNKEQHAAGSLALNFSVAEALIDEIYYAYGIVGNRPAKSFAKADHSVPGISKNQFSKWKMERKLLSLREGGLIDFYLHQRLDEARKLRNHLMHRAVTVSVSQSANMQSVVRDLWTHLIDEPFELLTGWSMRI